MRETDAFEQAYKNGFAAGMKAAEEKIVHCKDCVHWNEDALACDTLPWVSSSEHVNWYAEDFCSYGERREDG